MEKKFHIWNVFSPTDFVMFFIICCFLTFFVTYFLTLNLKSLSEFTSNFSFKSLFKKVLISAVEYLKGCRGGDMERRFKSHRNNGFKPDGYNALVGN